MARVSRANLLIGCITGGALLRRLPGFTRASGSSNRLIAVLTSDPQLTVEPWMETKGIRLLRIPHQASAATQWPERLTRISAELSVV